MPSRQYRSRRDSSSSSEYSEDSGYSRSTAPTEYSTERPFSKQFASYKADDYIDEAFYEASSPRVSCETYASTIASEEDLGEDQELYEEPQDYEHDAFTSTAVASTPAEFAELFPSTKRLCIRHDDTLDGNMNLRVDVESTLSPGHRVDLTLFHLRMHDLKNRDFSLRRYCRDSGREICHSSRKYTKPAAERRPGFQRSMSNALASLRAKSESKTATITNVKRNNSGYGSIAEDAQAATSPTYQTQPNSGICMPTNTTKLEFSNYAHIDVRRRGTKTQKRYDFEYWGTAYSWKRQTQKDGAGKEVSYHLINANTGALVAHIVPIPMTPAEAYEEQGKGGWIPPSSMWISDEKVLNGLTDVAE